MEQPGATFEEVLRKIAAQFQLNHSEPKLTSLRAKFLHFYALKKETENHKILFCSLSFSEVRI
jgi:hypothetical protein